jgi:carboxymethylenebutenolidase
MLKEQTVDGQANLQATTNLTPAQESLQALWEEHLQYEFGTHSTEDALATMDMELTPISRTIGTDQLVDEMVAKFTHTVWMEWILPGVAPTGKRVEVPVVAIVQFRDGKLAHEHIYWDQASVLVQVGLLDPGTLPVVGVDSARKAIDPNLPSNTLIERD